jgi:hypothetical protein
MSKTSLVTLSLIFLFSWMAAWSSTKFEKTRETIDNIYARDWADGGQEFNVCFENLG